MRVLIEQRKSRFFARVPSGRWLNPHGNVADLPGRSIPGGRTFEAQESYSAILPRFNILYRLSDDVNVFATVSKGRRSPVVSLNAARVGGVAVPNRQIVEEETVWNYEAGLKGSVGPVSGTLGSITRNMTASR